MEQPKYNVKSPGIKRLMREAVELAEPTDEYSAYPLEDNLFEWHFTVRGPPNTEFEEGIYHGRIILPTQYPMKPPDIILLTPNGRFETNKKICLSISGHHPESWQPSWSIRTALLALIAFMPTKTIGAIGSLDYSPDERRILARKSRDFVCEVCGKVSNKLSEKRGMAVLSAAEASLINEITSLADDKTGSQCEKTIKKIFEDNRPVQIQRNRDEAGERIHVINNVHNEQEEVNDNSSSCYFLPYVVFFMIAAIVILLLRRLFSYKFAVIETTPAPVKILETNVTKEEIAPVEPFNSTTHDEL